jgi:hypothetical protein
MLQSEARNAHADAAVAAGRAAAPRAQAAVLPSARVESPGVVELRRYTLHRGRRDALIELFERAFVESQEACGMHLLGQFRDVDDDDRFVWLRGFADMDSRAHALARFYGGPVWRAHREAANATMIDSDDVLLLRPLTAASGLAATAPRAAPGRPPRAAGLVTATTWHLSAPVDAALAAAITRSLLPALREAGARVLAAYTSEYAPNTYPALPVREGEHVLVCLCAFADVQHHAAHLARLRHQPGWRDAGHALGARMRRAPELLRLAPTPRSSLRG